MIQGKDNPSATSPATFRLVGEPPLLLLELSASLDREAVTLHALNISASDGGKPARSIFLRILCIGRSVERIDVVIRGHELGSRSMHNIRSRFGKKNGKP